MRLLLLFMAVVYCQLGFTQGILNKVKAKAQEKIENLGTKKKSSADTSTKDENEGKNEASADTTVAPVSKEAELIAYRKFGFVRGSNIIYEYAFEEVEVGDYPKSWMSDVGGEVVTLSNYPGKWLKANDLGNHFVDYFKEFPANFTFEFDVVQNIKPSSSDYNEVFVVLASTKGERNFNSTIRKSESSGFTIDLDLFKPWLEYENHWSHADSTNSTFIDLRSPNQYDLSPFRVDKQKLHVSLVRQDTRLICYLNTTRVFDLRNAFAKNTLLNNLNFYMRSQLEDPNSGLYISNLVLAETVMDTRKDLFVDGKYVTNSILFETNSDKIQPASLPSVGVVADYMKANPTVKLNVIGHTDNVGQDAANMDLSARRAKSVVKELVDFHKIDPSRLTSEGMGESKSIGDNNTLEGRAKNRRVEFIKQ
jgi:flagellar motor protein MotB